MDHKLRKYLAYGLGELLLVIVGILIALQIDNWNEDRKERATLQSYLESISRNMREDLVELEELRSWRHDALWAGGRMAYLFNRDSLDRDEIFFLNQALLLGTDERYFSPNTSGFEALKASGVLNRLQGSSLEQLISAYYDIVAQVGRLEGNLYDVIRPMFIEMGRDQPREMEGFAYEKQKKYEQSIEAYQSAGDQASVARVNENREIDRFNASVNQQNEEIEKMKQEAAELEEELKELEIGGGPHAWNQ